MCNAIPWKTMACIVDLHNHTRLAYMFNELLKGDLPKIDLSIISKENKNTHSLRWKFAKG